MKLKWSKLKFFNKKNHTKIIPDTENSLEIEEKKPEPKYCIPDQVMIELAKQPDYNKGCKGDYMSGSEFSRFK